MSKLTALLVLLSLPVTACQAQLEGGALLADEHDVATEPDPVLADYNSLDELNALCDGLGGGPHPGTTRMRRLTHSEYDATVRDLLQDESAPSHQFPPQARSLGFYGLAEGQSVSTVLVEGYQQAAKALAQTAAGDADGLMGCDPAQAGCVDDFLHEIGSAAYRRPITDAEVARLLPLFAWGRDNQTVTDGVEMVLEVLLQSPDFLYRPEFGDEQVRGGVMRMSSYEMASRLSYLFLASMPDAPLLLAAAKNELSTPAQVRSHAARLLGDPRSRASVSAFHAQWLALESVDHLERDPAIYPGYTSEVPGLLVSETAEFINHVIFDSEGTLTELFTAPYTMANKELADFYGLVGPTGTAFEVVPTGAERAGLLTQGSLLAHHAQPLQTSPVHRGKFVRESILCQLLTPPPANLVIVPPELDPGLTTRERFGQHSADAACAQCHKLMDPLGLGFEHFDPVGRYRAEENGLEIDATGELFETDVDGKFDGAVELGQKLAESPQVASCMTKQWMRYSQGRSAAGQDACSLAAVATAFEESDHNIKELILALTATDAFLYRDEVKP